MEQDFDHVFIEDMQSIASGLSLKPIVNGGFRSDLPCFAINGNSDGGYITILFVGERVDFQKAVDDTKRILKAYGFSWRVESQTSKKLKTIRPQPALEQHRIKIVFNPDS